MKKGIIMDMNERFLTLLTPEGEFIRISKREQDYKLGQEIMVPIQEKPALSFTKTIKGKSMVAAALACMLALFTFLPFSDNDVYAYMSIDVNPSIELGVNDKLQVIELIPYNAEGEQIVAELDDWKKKDITVVADNILSVIKKNGYLEQERQIIIGTVHTGESEEETEAKLEEALLVLEDNIASEEAEVISVEATEEERETALEKGVTTGKLIIEQKAKEEKKQKETSSQKTQKKSVEEAEKQQKLEQTTIPNAKNENEGKGQDKKLEKAKPNEGSKIRENNRQKDTNGQEDKKSWNKQDKEKSNWHKPDKEHNGDNKEKDLNRKNNWDNEDRGSKDKHRHDKQEQKNDHSKNNHWNN